MLLRWLFSPIAALEVVVLNSKVTSDAVFDAVFKIVFFWVEEDRRCGPIDLGPVLGNAHTKGTPEAFLSYEDLLVKYYFGNTGHTLNP